MACSAGGREFEWASRTFGHGEQDALVRSLEVTPMWRDRADERPDSDPRARVRPGRAAGLTRRVAAGFANEFDVTKEADLAEPAEVCRAGCPKNGPCTSHLRTADRSCPHRPACPSATVPPPNFPTQAHPSRVWRGGPAGASGRPLLRIDPRGKMLAVAAQLLAAQDRGGASHSRVHITDRRGR